MEPEFTIISHDRLSYIKVCVKVKKENINPYQGA